MRKKTLFLFTAVVLIILAAIIYFSKINSKEYKNNLSKLDTFDRFITLVEEGKYEDAKKYTSADFTSDLSTIKDIRISQKQKNYELSEENKFVYVDTYEIGYYKATTKYCFELQETNCGWKITKFYDEITDNMEEVNELIY